MKQNKIGIEIKDSQTGATKRMYLSFGDFISLYEIEVLHRYLHPAEYEYDSTEILEYNYFLHRFIAGLDDREKAKFHTISRSGIVELTSLCECINLTYSLNNFYILQDTPDYESLGRYYIAMAKLRSPDCDIANSSDPEYVGKDVAEFQKGKFLQNLYIGTINGTKLSKVYSGNPDDIPTVARL